MVGFHRSANIFAVLVFLGCAVWGHSQQQAQTPVPLPTIKANARLVLVDVIPTDSHGDFVSDLARDDFKILEDGKQQPIVSIEIYSSKNNAPLLPEPPNPVIVRAVRPVVEQGDSRPDGSINIILLDSFNTEMADQGLARRDMLKFLKALPSHRPMIVFILGTRLRLLQSLTGNTDQLIAAVDKVLTSKSIMLVTPDDKEQQEADLLRMAELGFPIERLRQFLAESDARSLDRRVEITCDALRQLARSVARYPGRKNLLWLSGAYPFSVEPDSRLMDPWAVQRNYAPMVQATAAAMSRANIAVYPIDVHGLMPTAIPASTPSIVGFKEGQLAVRDREHSIVDAQSTMQEIADQTGGKAFYNTNDLKQSIARSIDNGASYYVLSYTPPQGNTNGQFRKIRVEVDRKHLSLAYRRGYYAEEFGPPINDAQLARELQLAMDRESPPSTELLVSASVQSNQNGTLTLQYSVNKDQLKIRDPKGGPLDLTFLASLTAWNKAGKTTSHLVQKVHVPLTPELEAKIEKTGVTLTLSANSGGDYSQIRVGVLDLRTGRIGITDILPAHKAK